MAVFIPTIAGYEPFYIHRDADATATNILTTYGVVVKDSGYPMNRKAKEPYKNDWKDRSGDDEWNTQINYEAFTYDLEAAIFIRVTGQVTEASARQQLAAAVRSFEDFIKNGEFKFYSAWHCFGFQKVRIDEFHAPDSSKFGICGDLVRVYFTFSVKVNDPITAMTYNSTQNKIVAAT
jgi:hypothetical protein